MKVKELAISNFHLKVSNKKLCDRLDFFTKVAREACEEFQEQLQSGDQLISELETENRSLRELLQIGQNFSL